VDQAFVEVAAVATERAGAVHRLESEVASLSLREAEARERLATLERVPPEAMRHFEVMLKKGDRRSARRDYALFTLGAVVSALFAMLLKRFELG
jgi:hypothetical protein